MSQFKRKLSAFTAMLAFVSVSSMNAFAVEIGDVAGKTHNMGITGGGNRIDVNLNGGTRGDVGQVDWRNFSVPGGQTVNFGFSGLNQTTINRVLGGQQSEILGKLTSSCVTGGSCTSFEQTSNVILINPAGVLFGAGSAVDLNSFTVSTFDFNGARNLSGMKASEIARYQANTLNKLSPVSAVNGEGRNYSNIHFDSNYTDAFTEAGIAKSSYYGKTKVEFAGAADNPVDLDINKSFGVISDNIDYRNSLLKTADNYNYITGSGESSYSNVRLVTADGVTFKYLQNGYIDNYTIDEDSKTDVVRNINIDNAALAADQVAIKTGNLHIRNQSKADGSNINISNSVIKANKLVNTENGDIMIVGSKNVTVDNSRLETKNTKVTYNGVTKDTLAQKGGEIYIRADEGDATVTDSLLMTAGSSSSNANAGKVRIYSFGKDVNIENSKVLARGGADIDAVNNTTIDGSLIQAQNIVDPSATKNINIASGNKTTVNDTALNAYDINISSKSGNNLNGNVTISSTQKDGKNQTLIIADNNLNIRAGETKIDNASLVYKDITFYDENSQGLNNVTIANNSTFSPTDANGDVRSTVSLETNGDLILDNATLKNAQYSLTFDRVDPADQSSNLIDDGTANAITYHIDTPATQDVFNLTLTSKEGNVTVKNNSNVNVRNTANLVAEAGNVNVFDSTFAATNNANLTANNNIQVTNSHLTGAKGANLTANTGNITINTAGGGMFTSTQVKSDGIINLTANNGDVTVRTAMVSAGSGLNGTTNPTDAQLNNASLNINAINFTAQDGSLGATGNINVNATNDITVNDTTSAASLGGMTFTAGNDANFGSTGYMGYTTAKKDINVNAGNDINVTGNSTLTSREGNTSLIADNNVNITNATVKATKGDVNVTANNGAVKILNSATLNAGQDLNITSEESIKLGLDADADTNIGKTASLTAGRNMKIKAKGTGSDIVAEKTEMSALKYGGRLTFDANHDNIITSANSLKGVNIDFVAGNSNRISSANDMHLVNSSLESKLNEVSTTVDGDVILNALTIKKATADAKDTVTRINAKGNVTTADVTKTVTDDLAKTQHTALEDVEYNTAEDATSRSYAEDAVNVNQTKLIVTTNVPGNVNPDDDTVRNNSNGSIFLYTRGANNKDAGLELTAENTTWDGQIGAGEGPEVTLNAVDDQLSVSKIITDKLTLFSNDEMYAADVELTPDQLAGLPEGTPSKGYIEVRDRGGFNMDNSTDYGNETGFGYTGNYDSNTETEITENITKGESWEEKVTYQDPTDPNYQINETWKVTETSGSKTQTDTTTDKKHTIDFNNKNENSSNFILVYDKVTVENTDLEVPETERELISSERVSCVDPVLPDIPPDIDPDDRTDNDIDNMLGGKDSLINQQKLPREQVETSKSSRIYDNTADKTEGVMAAASKLEVTDPYSVNGSNADKDDEFEDEDE